MSSSEHLFYMQVTKKEGESWINEMEMFGFSHLHQKIQDIACGTVCLQRSCDDLKLHFMDLNLIPKSIIV